MSDKPAPGHPHADPSMSDPERRGFLQTTSGVVMVAGMAASYGTLGYCAARFLFPAEPNTDRWQFVATVDQLAAGDSLEYVAPSGVRVVVARQGAGNEAADFVALSSVCPHLGCQVHWQAVENRFFCPCHNGAFDPAGQPTAGPPLASKTPLSRFPLKVDGGLLFIQVPMVAVVPSAVAASDRSARSGDDCRRDSDACGGALA